MNRVRSLQKVLCCSAGMVVLLTACLAGESQPDPWLIVLGGVSGSINARTKREDLVRRYGNENVVDQDVDIGEGQTEPGTTVFPNDPKRAIEILWKNPAEKIAPKLLMIQGSASVWKGAHEISLGTSLKELETLNGRSFRLFGLQWDYSGTVSSWEGGLLEKDLQGKGRVVVRLDSTEDHRVTEEEASEVAGDRDFSSQHPVMQKMNPCVYAMQWEFP